MLSKLLLNTKPIKFTAYQYHAADKTQFYLFLEKGLHSNNARVVVAQKGLQPYLRFIEQI
jgi:hypothetical protein